LATSIVVFVVQAENGAHDLFEFILF